MAVRFRFSAQGGSPAARGTRLGALLVAALLLAGVLYNSSSLTSFAVTSSAVLTSPQAQSVLSSLRELNGGSTGDGGLDGSSNLNGGDTTADERRYHVQGDGVMRSPVAEPDPQVVKQRCGATRGDWCGRYDAQSPIPALPPPLGNISCLWGNTEQQCNFVGVCDAMRGWCRCPAGWTGDDCSTRLNRPCSQHIRSHGFEPYDKPYNSLKHGGTTMACADQCDVDVGKCYCNATFAHGRVPAALDMPPGTPPTRVGRPIAHFCRRNKDWDGTPVEFGGVELDQLYGEKGWCQADQPSWTCACIIDGLGGPYCDTVLEQFCVNQCNGHGECNNGWCKCHEGWFGHDCSSRLKGVPWSAGMEDKKRPWLKQFVHTPAAKDPEPSATRKRPLIYVYDLPALYNSHMLQYRVDKASCVHRTFTDTNSSHSNDGWLYQIETALHEMLLQSEHRTLDPEEADYFYLPVYVSCLIYPVLNSNDFPYFHGGPVAWRTHAGTNMFLEVYHWIRSHHPYWDRNGGKDHIVLSVHDEGSCWVPKELRPAIVLSHWGRTDLDHVSGTGFWPDNYTADSKHLVWQPEGHVDKIGRFPCYDPLKDLVIPPMFSPLKYQDSPALGAPTRERHILGFFKGRLQHSNPAYSRGIRQFLANHSQEHDWWGQHKIYLGDGWPPGEAPNYSQLLTSSTFSFAIMGDGWSSRFEDGLMHGCIPVIIQDGVELAWSSILDIESYSIRVEQKDMERIPEILKAVTPEKIREMQANIKKVWRRYIWTTSPLHRQQAQALLKRLEQVNQPDKEGGGSNGGGRKLAEDPFTGDAEAGQADSEGGEGKKEEGGKKSKKIMMKAESNLLARHQPALDGPYDPAEDDAFSTLMQWLYSRVDVVGAHAPKGRRPESKE